MKRILRQTLRSTLTFVLCVLPMFLVFGYAIFNVAKVGQMSSPHPTSFADPANRSVVYININATRGSYSCSGFLIQDRYVASAAHCFSKHPETQPLADAPLNDDPGAISVYFGFISLSEFKARCTATAQVPSEYKNLGGFNSDYKWDFALVTLSDCANTKGRPTPIPISWTHVTPVSSEITGDQFKVTGFPGDTHALATSNGTKVSACLTPICVRERWGLRTTAYARPGVSGSPIYNNGNVVGIVVASTYDASMARKLDNTVKTRFKSWSQGQLNY